MRKILTLICLASCLAVSGFAQQIRDIDETVVLRPDGSARVTQVWDVNVVSGTEFYLPFDNLGPMDITDLSVSEDGETFVSEGDGWNTDRTREQKRGRCGIVRKRGGVELCWGQGDYGDHVWTVSYTVKGLVMQMGSYAGLYFTFVNPGLSAPPQHVKLTLINDTDGPAWTPDNVLVWGFRSDSEIYVEDGVIRAESKSPFGSNSAMTVLARFEPGLFSPAVTYSKDFEKVRKMAFRGSDYKEKMTFKDILSLIFTALVALVVFLLSPGGWLVLGLLYLLYLAFTYYVLGQKYNKSIFGKRKIKGWYRDVPLEGSLPAAYYALSKGDRMWSDKFSNNLIGAYFLRWVMLGQVTVLPNPRKPKRVNLSFEKEACFDEPVENDLYAMVREASGENLILEEGELEKWSKKSFRKLSNIPGRVQTVGRKWFEDRHLSKNASTLTPAGHEQARHLIEFQNFLRDFTLNEERGAVEAGVWEDLLVFAALFGIADKVAEQFAKLYPAQFSEFTQATGINPSTFQDLTRVSHDISASAMRQAATEKAAHSGGSYGGGRIGGGGGGFSMGGGGGSFGGSFGGGSR